jgi:hypothetical protein
MMIQNDLRDSWQNVVTEFHSKSDRAAAILGAAFLEAHLGELIGSFFIESCDQDSSLLEVDRPLGTFSARVRGAYCMGLISNTEYHDLNLIMQIQHIFSNQVYGAAFTDNGIREKCFQLRIPRQVLLPGETHIPRQLFVFATAILTQQLAWRAQQAEKKRCKVPEDFMLIDAED